MKIGEKTIEDVQKRVGGLIRMYLKDINGVFEEDGNIKISMPVDLKMDNGKIKVKVGCSFVTSKIDDTSTGVVDETQLDLPLEPMRKCPINPGETRTERFCGNCELRRTIIFPEPATGEKHGSFIQSRPCSAWSDDDTRAHITRMLLWEPAPEIQESKADCNGCQYHKAMINKKHGIKIPGMSGKCIRQGGLCESVKEAA